MADYGHDPTETAIPYAAFKSAGFQISFATERGTKPACDTKMLTGWTQKLLGANQNTLKAYEKMAASLEFSGPIAWASPEFTLDPYNLVFLPGGHDKGVQQVIDSSIVQSHLADYFPGTERHHGSQKAIAAICHGVLGLSKANDPYGKSVLYGSTTTALPGIMEQGIWWATRAVLGNYYKTYGAGSDSVEAEVKKRLNFPDIQWKSSLSPTPFVVEDTMHNYLSGRYPPDAQLLADKAIALVQKIMTPKDENRPGVIKLAPTYESS